MQRFNQSACFGPIGVALCGFFAAFVVATSCGFGPLNPPAGAVTGTAKPLTEIEPRVAINTANTPGDADSSFKITQPGSYYLTGNITGVAGKCGIEVAANDVTIDLAGFAVAGVPGSLSGIAGGGAFSGLQVRNGSVSHWGGSGVATSQVSHVIVESISAASNGDWGINCEFGGVVRACVACDNGRAGIALGWAGVIDSCAANNNRLNGITVYQGCTVSGCTAQSNTGVGIQASQNSTITGCTAQSNTAAGIDAGFASTVEGCTSYTNAGPGVLAGPGVSVVRCAVSTNDGAGISAANECVIDSCIVKENRLDGIVVPLRCAVRNNHCYGNGRSTGDGAGIHATAGGNRIEGNSCAGADRGIDVDAGLNFIARNICEGNSTNWTVVAGNFCLVVQAIPGGAINGNTGGTAVGPTDPNANFTY